MKHPESLASRHICREVLGRAVDVINQRTRRELENCLLQKESARIDAYYVLIR